MNGIRTVGFLLIASTLCVLSPLLADVQAKRFQVGYFQVSPHAMPDVQGRAQGVAVAYFKRIVEKMGIADVHFRLFPLQRLLVALENNQLEMALLFARNPGREAAFVYPRRPFCYTQPCIAVPAAHWLKTIESIAPLLTLSIQESAGAYRSAFIQDPRIKLEPMHGDDYTPRCFSKLLLNRIDACYQPDHYPLVFEANKNQYDSRIRVITLPEPPIGLYSVFSKQSAGIYLQSYETALDEVAREITYEDLFKAFIDKNAPE
jgi:polar amino acid transport system substrate-binding protein